MRIGDREVTWREGRCLIFDDTVSHSVWNATSEERAVLLIDVHRPMRLPGRIVSAVFLAGLRRHGYYRDAKAKQHRWEERFHGPGGASRRAGVRAR